MRAELKRLRFPDLDARPADASLFGEAVELNIGEEGAAAADTFSAMVCSPLWLSQQCRDRGPIWGRHFLIGQRFDQAAIEAAIKAFCADCSGGSWHELVDQLRRFADWEFDSYDTDRPTSAGAFGRLLAIDCPGHDLDRYLPERTDSFHLPLRITMGDGNNHSAEFGLTACTPDRVMSGAAGEQFVPGYGLLILADYDCAQIREAIKRRCERLWGDSWSALVKQMAQYAPQLC